MHYNQGADLLTYLNNPEVFAVKEGYVDILQGPCFFWFLCHHGLKWDPRSLVLLV